MQERGHVTRYLANFLLSICLSPPPPPSQSAKSLSCFSEEFGADHFPAKKKVQDLDQVGFRGAAFLFPPEKTPSL